MIMLLLFWEFFKIGLLAVGGGLVTIPFLMNLSVKHNWFSIQQLTDMIAVSESTPGPIGINMATYVGFHTSGIGGAVIATTGLVVPSLIVIIFIARFLFSENKNCYLHQLLFGIRPAVLGLILYAGAELGKLALVSWQTAVVAAGSFALIRWLKWHPVVFIVLGVLVGIVFKL